MFFLYLYPLPLYPYKQEALPSADSIKKCTSALRHYDED